MLPLAATERADLLEVARQSLEAYFRGSDLPEIATTSSTLMRRRAAFVTLRRRDTGELRGCRGEAEPRRPLIQSVRANAIAAAVDDPRFEPVTHAELRLLAIHISALTVPVPIQPDEVILGRHGLMIVHGRRTGLLLPRVPSLYGLEDVPTFLDALCRKAGLPASTWNHPATRLYGFEAEDWGEPNENPCGS
jgi:hypothetical protein